MIRRQDMSPEAWAAMCIPINEVLPAEPRTGEGALFIGSWFASIDEELLDAHDVRALVCVNDSLMVPSGVQRRRGTYKIVIPDSTNADLRPHLDGVVRHIAEQRADGVNVLVHCQQGISRSSAVVIAYLMQEKGMTYDDSLALVKSKRRCANPNIGFERTLRALDRELKATR